MCLRGCPFGVSGDHDRRGLVLALPKSWMRREHRVLQHSTVIDTTGTIVPSLAASAYIGAVSNGPACTFRRHLCGGHPSCITPSLVIGAVSYPCAFPDTGGFRRATANKSVCVHARYSCLGQLSSSVNALLSLSSSSAVTHCTRRIPPASGVSLTASTALGVKPLCETIISATGRRRIT